MAAVTDTDSQSQHVAHSQRAMRCWSIVNVLCALALSVHWHQAHVGKHVLLINMFDAQNVRVFFCFNSTASFFFHSLSPSFTFTLHPFAVHITYYYYLYIHAVCTRRTLLSRAVFLASAHAHLPFGVVLFSVVAFFVRQTAVYSHLVHPRAFSIAISAMCALKHTHIRERTLDS